MKKISVTLIALSFFAASVIAQTNFQLYKFTSMKQSEIVLKALGSKLQLSDKEFAAVKQLLESSATSQVEQFKTEISKDAEVSANIVRRQTMHIESNLKNIVGEEKYKQYESLKPSIEKMAQDIGSK